MALALMGPGGGGSKITAKMISNMTSTRGVVPYITYGGILCCNLTSNNATAYIQVDLTYLKQISFNVGYYVNNGSYGNHTGVVWIGSSYDNYDTTLYKTNVTIKNAPDGVFGRIDNPQKVTIDVSSMTGKYYLCLQAPGIRGEENASGYSNNVYIANLRLDFDV